MGKFADSWSIAKTSFNVLLADKELLVYPLFTGLSIIVFGLLALYPLISLGFFLQGASKLTIQIISIIIIFLSYLIVACIATFFNACMVYTAKTRFEGENATISSSISFVFSRFHNVFLWGLMSATVNIVIATIERQAKKFGVLGRAITIYTSRLLGAAWSIATVFVVQVIVFKNVGPIQALKGSVETIKQRWGESIILKIGMGTVQLVCLIPGLVFGLIALYLVTLPAPNWIIFGFLGLMVFYVAFVFLIFICLETIYQTAIYIYAQTGAIPLGFTQDQISAAIINKKSFL